LAKEMKQYFLIKKKHLKKNISRKISGVNILTNVPTFFFETQTRRAELMHTGKISLKN
jgi:hypothetical protein